MGLRRANVGCGTIPVEGWFNYDTQPISKDVWYWDARTALVVTAGDFDYAVSSFMLNELDFHELPGVIENLRSILRPGGTLRVLVPDVMSAFNALVEGDEDWFPQDERSGDIDGKFCSYVTWYGTAKSVFTGPYLEWLLAKSEWSSVKRARFGATTTEHSDICSLDSRPKEAMIYEATR